MERKLARKNFNEDQMTLNLGPQHPSTHGVLRLKLKLRAEKILKCEPVLGYLHRGMEKMAQNRTYYQYLPTVDRVDYLSGFFYSQAYCSAVEELLNVEIPIRAQYIRVLTMELNRIASHLLWLGTYMMDLGASSPIFYTFNLRNNLLCIFEELTGSRMMYNYYTFGGVRCNIEEDILNKIKEYCKIFPKKLKDLENIITNNPIFRDRTENLGVITIEDALQYSLSGVNLRASAADYDKGIDYRKAKPYLCYEQLDFKVPLGNKGDSYDRYLLRIEEMKQSLYIAEQCIDWLLSNPHGNINLNIKPMHIKPDEGYAVSCTESARGLVMCFVRSDGSANPKRVKWRCPSFYSVQILEKLAPNNYIADLMSIFGSLDVVIPEVDR